MTVRLSVVVLLLIGIAASFAIAENAPAEEEHEMTTYQLVFVLDDPDFEEDPMVPQDRADHRKDRFKTVGRLYLKNLVKDGVAIIAGPLQEHERIQQVAVLAVETTKDAEMMFDHAPGIEAGRLERIWTLAENITETAA